MPRTTNTENAITNAAQAQKEAPVKKSPATMMNAVLNAESTKKLLENSLKENAGAFAASVLDLYSTDKLLQRCEPGKVFAECLKAVSLKLPINKQLGFAYIIPYGDVPTFIIGYKGLLQLAQRTGAYRYINTDIVYEGELKSVDKLTGSVDLSGERSGDNIIGYFAYIQTVSGFEKTLYWSKEKVMAHAARYSKSYAKGNPIWKDNFHEMAQKTVLRNLLSKWSPLSVEMANAMSDDDLKSNGADSDALLSDETPIAADFEEVPADV